MHLVLTDGVDNYLLIELVCTRTSLSQVWLPLIALLQILFVARGHLLNRGEETNVLASSLFLPLK